MKAAVYTGTKNVYKDMVPSIKSLLIHSDVDKIYLLIEDDNFPYELPQECECINVSNQTIFSKKSINYNNRWTYMVLLRAALTKFFPNLDTILSLDIDTIINDNISELWDIDIKDYYLAAVKEPKKSSDNYLYINMGVVLFNLKKMREEHIDDVLIKELNTNKYAFNEQDVINKFCQGKILEISSIYNTNNYTIPNTVKKIIHFAAVKNWKTLPIINYYFNINIEKRNIKHPFGLDIIIPTYKNIEGLKKTLSHIPNYEYITVTVIDDHSEIDYTELKNQYNNIQFFTLTKNSGPGICRQIGLELTKNPYIMFIDTGDYIFSETAIQEIKTLIVNNPALDLYKFQWFNEEHSTFSGQNNLLLHGTIYNRQFLNIYNIKFSYESSYSNEDVGFNRACKLIEENIALYDHTPHEAYMPLPILYYEYNKNSITHINNNEFIYSSHIKGLSINISHAINIAERNNVQKDLIIKELASRISELYFYFLKCVVERPQYAEDNWQYIKNFYLNTYIRYKDLVAKNIDSGYRVYTKRIEDMANKKHIAPNIRGFIEELNNFNQMPQQYKL